MVENPIYHEFIFTMFKNLNSEKLVIAIAGATGFPCLFLFPIKAFVYCFLR